VSARFRLLAAIALCAVPIVAGAAVVARSDINSVRGPALADALYEICVTPFRAPPAEEAAYLADNTSAMTQMMVDMGIRPSGDVDRDFVAMMTPHHQGAIAMAQAELRYGHNEQLRRMAQEIIVTQQQEIAAMRLAIGRPLAAATAAPQRAAP
jgi:hypothetical protein